MFMIVDSVSGEVIPKIFNKIGVAKNAKHRYLEQAIKTDELVYHETAVDWVYSSVNRRRLTGTPEQLDVLHERVKYHSDRLVIKKIKEIVFE